MLFIHPTNRCQNINTTPTAAAIADVNGSGRSGPMWQTKSG
jgi:hypothetical protein